MLKPKIFMNLTIKNQIIDHLDLLVKELDPNYKIITSQEGDQIRFNIQVDSSKQNLIIGDNEETLSAIQHILRTLIHKNHPVDRSHFILDINNYRKERENHLTTKLPNLIGKYTLNMGKSIVLTGLTSYERLLIHRYLSDIKDIQTISVGMSTARKLLIMPTSNAGVSGLDNAMIIDISMIIDMKLS